MTQFQDPILKETAMCRIDERNSRTAPRRLTPEQWDHLKRHVIERAQDARGQAFRDLFGGVLSLSQAAVRSVLEAARFLGDRVLDVAGKRWSAYRLWRERRAAIRALGALDDRMLKDIGLGRSEIASAICDPERLAARAVAPARRPQRGACADIRGWPKPVTRPAASSLIDKTAA
jgi:uncharacterized protein YjiS (DUF1127 family)